MGSSWSTYAFLGALGIVSSASAGCFPVPPDIPSSPRSFDARRMEGTWYMIATNFPSWTGAKNTEPLLTYKLRSAPEGVVELDDLVAYKSSGDPSSYAGFDTQDPANDAHFTWRGNGVLALFPTEWYVAKVDPKGQWLITYYGDTLVSADAVDVIARTPDLAQESLDEALAVIQADPVLRVKAQGMKRVHLYGSAKAAPSAPIP